MILLHQILVGKKKNSIFNVNNNIYVCYVFIWFIYFISRCHFEIKTSKWDGEGGWCRKVSCNGDSNVYSKKDCKIHLEILQFLGNSIVQPRGIEYIVDYYCRFSSLKQLALSNKYNYFLKREILMFVRELFKVSFIGPIGISMEYQIHSSLNNR